MPNKTKIKIPQVKFFKPTLKTEALRILFTAHKIVTGQYQHFYWLVLPELPVNPRPHLIYFPDLKYNKINTFWSRVSTQVKQTTPPQAEKELLLSMEGLLSKGWDGDYYNTSAQKMEISFKKIEDEFWKDLFTVFPGFLGKLKTVNIYPTLYGTTKSFSVLNKKTINIYVRLDQQVSTIIEGLVSGLTREVQVSQGFTWEETEVAKDVILLTTVLGKYCTDYVSTIASTRFNQRADLKIESDKFLGKLGLKRDDSWKISGSDIFYKNKKVNNLTKKEQIVLEFLVENKERVVSIDELGSVIYPDPSNFSLWGLAKVVERLRKKLKINGLPGHLVQVHRKRGYSIFSVQRLAEVDENNF